VASFTLRPLYPPEEETRYPLDKVKYPNPCSRNNDFTRFKRAVLRFSYFPLQKKKNLFEHYPREEETRYLLDMVKY
jgi:hypothetical protein